jgi:hypothetical protein
MSFTNVAFIEEEPEGAPARRTRPIAEATPSVFRREGEYWTIVHAGVCLHLKDAKGLRYIARLLREPHREWHVTDLVAAEDGPRPHAVEERTPLLDGRAKESYRLRLADLVEDVSEARAFNDIGRAAKAQAELEFLTRELARAVGLGGRDRAFPCAAEQTRINATKRIKTAVRKIASHHSALGRYLAATIKTGAFCAYLPDPQSVVAWQL